MPTFNGRPTFCQSKVPQNAQNEIPCLYAIPHDQSDPANRLVPDREETLTLDNERQTKLNKDLVKPFDYTKLNNLVQENIHESKRVYYIEGLNHNLFSIGQFCDADLEVAFRKSKRVLYRDFSETELLTSNRRTISHNSLQETTSSTPICLMAKASPTQACKAKQSSFKSKTVPSSKGRLNLLHMDLCGPMRVASINGKKYILDETPEVLKDFLTMIQRNLQALVISVRTDKGTEFLNKTLNAFFKKEGIEHQTSTPRTPEQNGVVKRRNLTLVEAARTMLSASKLPLFLLAESNCIPALL
ncbi:retrovirus-related pol polyprotein from transposon TNT 1-94 [Tanacetum coccineum]